MSRESLRLIVGAVGLAGHTLPAIALARALRERGHEVLFHGWRRWRSAVEGLEIEFAGAREQIVELPGEARSADPATVARALLGSIERFGPDLVVTDALTLTPGLAAEAAGLPRATLFPEVYPVPAPGAPPFSLGLQAPRTAAGRAFWRGLEPALATSLPTTRWLQASFTALNRHRAALGLAPQARINDFSGSLNLVATLPELEYPRRWPRETHVVGPLVFDPPEPPGWSAPSGEGPLVVVAPSTVKDPEMRLARIALAALANEPVRLLVTTGGGALERLGPLPGNAVANEWIDYSRAIPEAALVICHGNHGTVARALAEGVPVMVCPATDDDAEHGARVTWAGAGAAIPRRLLSRASLRSAARRLLADDAARERALRIAAAARRSDPATVAAELIEARAKPRGRG